MFCSVGAIKPGDFILNRPFLSSSAAQIEKKLQHDKFVFCRLRTKHMFGNGRGFLSNRYNSKIIFVSSLPKLMRNKRTLRETSRILQWLWKKSPP